VLNWFLTAVVLLAWAAAVPLAQAQSSINNVRVYTDPPSAYFQVDGQNFIGSATFLWPATSKHVVTSYDQSEAVPGAQFVYQGWISNLNSTVSTSEPITADPSLQWIKLVFVASYLVTIDMVNCPDPAQPCASPGTVVLNGVSYSSRAQLYVAATGSVHAQAFPNSGYIFVGWGPIPGVPTAQTAFDITFQLTGPTQLSPNFQPATAIQTQVNVVTTPPQLQILLDRTAYVTPINLEWGWGTVHSLGAIPVQVAQGVTYVFSSWSDGGAINHDYTVASQAGAINLMANFVPASVDAFQTSPAGLTLSIDGQQNWPSYNFAWLPGSTHQISAPATQNDAQGHPYRFVSWSNGQPAAFTYSAIPAPGGDRLTATYQPVGQATVTSTPPGLTLQIDGNTCTTPCSIQKDVGATAVATAPSVVNTNAQSRLSFQGWGDSTALTRTITLGASPTTYTAAYTTQNLLTLTATPPNGANFSVTPASADGFYAAGTVVAVTAQLALGYKVTAWSGDITGSSINPAVTLDAPRSAALLLNPVPAIAPLGVQSAADGANPSSVAPGSLISIFGANLASDVFVASGNPLAQTLDSVTVRADNTFMPLVFVSPGQINAQLPGNLAAGSHNLTVRWEGKPETTAPLNVVRNAPGLFNGGQQNQPVGSFIRPDGSAVTPDHPAQVGDMISVLGTGLGPYVMTPPDGFVFDESAGYVLADAVSVMTGDSTMVTPLYAGRSGAGVGVDAVRFQVPANLPAGSMIPITVQVNNTQSNTVFLPVSQ
jgi:uncharacterized protein (TIGR03437 family)